MKNLKILTVATFTLLSTCNPKPTKKVNQMKNDIIDARYEVNRTMIRKSYLTYLQTAGYPKGIFAASDNNMAKLENNLNDIAKTIER